VGAGSHSLKGASDGGFGPLTGSAHELGGAVPVERLLALFGKVAVAHFDGEGAEEAKIIEVIWEGDAAAPQQVSEVGEVVPPRVSDALRRQDGLERLFYGLLRVKANCAVRRRGVCQEDPQGSLVLLRLAEQKLGVLKRRH